MQPHYTFHHELQKLNKKILECSAIVEDRVRRAAAVIHSNDENEINDLQNTDYIVDEMEVDIEEDCLKILALHQPVAGDLRFIITVIKINNEIERIADIAVSITTKVQRISERRPVPIDFDFKTMSEKTTSMLHMSLNALVNRDPEIARKVFLYDDEVDAMKREAYKATTSLIPDNKDQIHTLLNTYLLAAHLERIADRATNIAEEVIYLVEGTIVRSL